MQRPTPKTSLPAPHFTPVATRARHDGWTVARQCGFIAALVRFGEVTKAAAAVGMSVPSAYNLRRRAGGESFAAAWNAALDRASDRALGEAVRRATHGVTFARTYRGRFIGTLHRHDDEALLRVLRITTRGRRGR